MEVYWIDEKTKEMFESEDLLKGAGFDKKESKKIIKALSHISAVTSINQLPRNLCCHPIKQGKKFLHFTVDVPSLGGNRGKYRIQFIPVGDEFNLLDLRTITKVEILGIKKH